MKILTSILLVLCLALSSSARASSFRGPVQVEVTVITMGKFIDKEKGIVEYKTGDYNGQITISGCEIAWTENEEFYGIFNDTFGLLVVQTKVMDQLWIDNKEDFDASFLAGVTSKKVCLVKDAKLILDPKVNTLI